MGFNRRGTVVYLRWSHEGVDSSVAFEYSSIWTPRSGSDVSLRRSGKVWECYRITKVTARASPPVPSSVTIARRAAALRFRRPALQRETRNSRSVHNLRYKVAYVKCPASRFERVAMICLHAVFFTLNNSPQKIQIGLIVP